MAKLRGSKINEQLSTAEALEIALDVAKTEKELRQMILSVIKHLRSKAKKIK